jgi:hypothetical protein
MSCQQCYGNWETLSKLCFYKKQLIVLEDVADIIEAQMLIELEKDVSMALTFCHECHQMLSESFRLLDSTSDNANAQIYEQFFNNMIKHVDHFCYSTNTRKLLIHNNITNPHKNILKDIQSLSEIFADVRFTITPQSISGPGALVCTTMEPIILEGVNFGKFDIYYYLCPYIESIYCHALTPNIIYHSTHPHIKHHRLCAGSAYGIISFYKRGGHVLQYFETIYSILKTYRAEYSFERIELWQGIGCDSCQECGLQGYHFEDCQACRRKICHHCSKKCMNCYKRCCFICGVSCALCHDFICKECQKVCSQCGLIVCLGHYLENKKLCV